MTSLSSSAQPAMQGSPASCSSARRRQLRYVVAEIFSNIATANSELPRTGTAVQAIFDCQVVPGVSVHDYLAQLSKRDHRSERSWLYALILADHFCRQAKLVTCPYSVHRIAACSLLLALKMTCDTCRINGAVAPLAGISVREMNWMEATWLSCVGFNLNIHPEYYAAVGMNLGQILEHSRGLRSGAVTSPCELIPDWLRAGLPGVGATLHDYQPKSTTSSRTSSPSSAATPTSFQPVSPPQKAHDVYSRVSVRAAVADCTIPPQVIPCPPGRPSGPPRPSSCS
eukprot:TRINITY_DN390_c0_g1_i2.p1 TRINITY_DN390_c0_g1~~TRINITY_DN390_c0_g1_i2.p1  ORF type:complete len:310 (+),score=86.80 TRINITY_DN390_c0_g1_i2:81-932(+)